MTSIIKILSLSTLFVFLTLTAQAQKDNAHIQYVLNFEGNEQAAMFNGSLLDVYFTPDNSKLVLNVMDGVIKGDVRVNMKTKKGIMLMNMMGNQKYKELNLDKDKVESETKNAVQPDIKYIEEYKEIAGYKCQKALLNVQGEAEPMVIYFTEKVALPSSLKNYLEDLDLSKIKGIPMAFEINSSDLKIQVTAQLVDLNKQSKKIFDAKIPEGYTEMTKEDLEGLGGMSNF